MSRIPRRPALFITIATALLLPLALSACSSRKGEMMSTLTAIDGVVEGF